MKFCKNCGHQLIDSQKVCTRCGTPVQQPINTQHDPSAVPPVNERTAPQHDSHHTASNEEQVTQQPEVIYNSNDHMDAAQHESHTAPVKQPMSRRNLGLILGALALLLVLAAAYMMLSSRYSPEKTTDHIITAMNAKDADALSGLLSSSSNNISKDEAQAFIDYMHSRDAVDEFNNQLKSSTNAMLANNVVQSDVYAGETKVLDLSQNGKKFGLFKQYLYDIPAQTVTITPNEDSKLSFKINDKNYSKDLVKNHEQKLGQFVLGDYSIPATKTVDGSKFKGKLDINMSDDSTTAVEAFDLAYIRPSVSNTYGIDEGSIKLYVDGKATDYDFSSYEDKVGPFKSGDNVELYAEGKIGDKTFKTDTASETVNEVEDNEAIDVELSFDDNEISSYAEDQQEKQQELAETQNEVKSIDLTSEHFSTTFMKANHVNGYRGVNIGMKKAEIEKLLGEADEDFDPLSGNVKKYGNFAIEYDDKDKVAKYYVVPDVSIDEDELEDYYGTSVYKQTTDQGKNVYYDWNRSNGFVVVIVMDDDGYMEYMYQTTEKSSDPWR